MNLKKELPISKPFFSANHGQGTVTSIIHSNPSMINWYYNNVMVLSVSVNKDSDYFQPYVDICQSGIEDNPFIERQRLLLTFLDGSVNRIIRNMIDKEYYVYFGAIDDYYMKGKAGYHNYHFPHDGMICGYDQENKTYSVYAYDEEMKYRVFQMPQICFERARKSTERMGICGFLTAMKPMKCEIAFDPALIKTRLQEYLDPQLTNNNLSDNSIAYGIITQKYLIEYIETIIENGFCISYSDLKSFKMIMEHKVFMLDRIKKIEEHFHTDNSISREYENVAAGAKRLWNMCLYCFYKKDNNKLGAVKSILEGIDGGEKEILRRLISLY